MAKKHILLVDGNSLLHANHHATPLTVGGMQVQAIFGMLRSLKSLMSITPGDKELLVAWDGRAQFRMELLPEYKANRVAADPAQQASKDAFKRQAPFVEKALSMLGIRQMRSPLLEADDLAGHLIPKLAEAGHRVTMVSGDKDWLQMVGPLVTWYDPIRDRRVNESNFLEFTGYFHPAGFVQGKALTGDNSDNISGVGGIGEKGAPLFVAEFGSVKEFLKRFDAGEFKKLPAARQRLASPEGRAVFERNLKLMDWSLSRRPEPGEVINTPAIVDVAGFETLCQRLAFASILRDFTPFLAAFNITHIKETA